MDHSTGDDNETPENTKTPGGEHSSSENELNKLLRIPPHDCEMCASILEEVASMSSSSTVHESSEDLPTLISMSDCGKRRRLSPTQILPNMPLLSPLSPMSPETSEIRVSSVISNFPVQNIQEDSSTSREESIQNIKDFLQKFAEEIEGKKSKVPEDRPREPNPQYYFRPISANSSSQEAFLGFPPSSPRPSCSHAPPPELVVPSGFQVAPSAFQVVKPACVRVASCANSSTNVVIAPLVNEQAFRQLIQVFPQRKPVDLRKILLDHGNDLDRAIDSILQPQKRKRKLSSARSNSTSAETGIPEPTQNRQSKKSKHSSKCASLERYTHVFNVHPDIIVNKDRKTYYIIPAGTQQFHLSVNNNTNLSQCQLPPNVEKETQINSKKEKGNITESSNKSSSTKKFKTHKKKSKKSRKKGIFTSTTLFTQFVGEFFETMREFYGTCGKSLHKKCSENASMLELLKKNSNVLNSIIKIKTSVENEKHIDVPSVTETETDINYNHNSSYSTDSIVSQNNVEPIVVSSDSSEHITAQIDSDVIQEHGKDDMKKEPEYNISDLSSVNTILIEDQTEAQQDCTNESQNLQSEDTNFYAENMDSQNIISENDYQGNVESMMEDSSDSKLQIYEDSNEYDSAEIIDPGNSNEAVNNSSMEVNIDTDETINTSEADATLSPPTSCSSPFIIYSRSQTFSRQQSIHYTNNTNEIYTMDEHQNYGNSNRTTFQNDRSATALPVSEDRSNSIIETPSPWNIRPGPNIGRGIPLNYPTPPEINYPMPNTPSNMIQRCNVPANPVQSSLRRTTTPPPNYNHRTSSTPVPNYNLPLFSQQFPIHSRPMPTVDQRLNFMSMQLQNSMSNSVPHNFGLMPPLRDLHRSFLPPSMTFPPRNNLAVPFDLSIRRDENNSIFRYPINNNELAAMFPPSNQDRRL